MFKIHFEQRRQLTETNVSIAPLPPTAAGATTF